METPYTVLIGSKGRDSLRFTLDSIARQARIPGDQVIVAFDSFEQTPEWMSAQIAAVQAYGAGFEACAYDAGYHWLGVEQINHAWRTMPITGTHIFTLGDDDVFVDHAYDVLRPKTEREPLRPILYRFVAPYRMILWDQRRLRQDHISGCCIAAPKRFVREMTTIKKVTHDYDWILDIVKASECEPVWLDATLVIARPDTYGEDVMHRGVWSCWNCRRFKFYETIDPRQTHCECGAIFELPRAIPRRVPA